MLNVQQLTLSTILIASAAAMGCASSGGSTTRSQSPRAQWIESPSRGQAADKQIRIPGLAVSFEIPDVLYVFRDCVEAAHSPDGPGREWIPVIQCDGTGPSGGEDDFDDEGGDGSDRTMTIYVAHKKQAINERTVETMRADFERAGVTVAEIAYHENYVDKENRRGIEAKLQHFGGADSRYPTSETLRFTFAADDVVFIADTEYPFGTDVSGILSDWQRILWSFQLDEEGPLYGGEAAPAGEEAAAE
ncbi:MAG: hypothetical protein B7733_07965 [Myxococcales bacterium FL481]|nr:MAG: hypothetical protein B7733_07965 [Myxococcales bacterium FL481]